jgi:antitoxin (DNA-binding transcriptional repressor) of toxin-antitoxin stability system
VYLARVKRGERLVVTEHRQVVAVLAPAEMTDDPLARLIAAGRATAARRPVAALPRPLASRSRVAQSEAVREQSADAA